MHQTAKTEKQFYERYADRKASTAPVVASAPAPTPRLTIDEVRTARAMLGMSQAVLSVSMGHSPRYVEELEAGRRKIPPYLRLVLLALLDGHR